MSVTMIKSKLLSRFYLIRHRCRRTPLHIGSRQWTGRVISCGAGIGGNESRVAEEGKKF